MTAWGFHNVRLSAVLVTALAAGLLVPLAVSSPAGAEEVASSQVVTPPTSSSQGSGLSISGELSYLEEDHGLSVPITEGNGWIELYNSEGWYDITYPDAEGAYTFLDVRPGRYYLKAGYTGQDYEGVPDEWYLDKPSQARSTSFTVTVSTPRMPLREGATHMLSPHALPW